MSAIATAKTTECSFTAHEGLQVMRMAWAAVEEWQISLYPPYVEGNTWLAAHKREGGGGYLWGFGASPIEAVEDLLVKIGGANG